MDDALLDIAASWSFWDKPLPRSIPRDVALPDALRESLALVVQGVRRCGKSTLLQQILGRYRLDPARCAFVNFEDPRLSNALHHTTLDALVAAFRARHPTGSRYFFLDEIQWVDGWQRWLRARLDRPAGDVFVVTGSNARLLSGELSSVLTGRHITVELYPFDLVEAQRRDRGVTVERWLHDGGFPEPTAMSDGDRLLRQYFIDIVERDVRERIGGRSSLAIRQVVQMVFESAGSEMSLRRVAGAAGIAVETAASWLEACEAAYLLFACPWFAFSERKRAARNVKYYPVDTGLRRVVVTATGGDRGKSLECAVHLALRRRYGQVYYWRGRGEVDFVVLRDGRPLPIQVTWDERAERHDRALEAFYEEYPQADEARTVTAATFPAEIAGLDAR
jgi:predicted AAA+ superfamily ATPase